MYGKVQLYSGCYPGEKQNFWQTFNSLPVQTNINFDQNTFCRTHCTYFTMIYGCESVPYINGGTC